ncbi:hypothetical protein DCC62_28920, partial [candidate division KSB1 bacterium]
MREHLILLLMVNWIYLSEIEDRRQHIRLKHPLPQPVPRPTGFVGRAGRQGCAFRQMFAAVPSAIVPSLLQINAEKVLWLGQHI